MFYLPLFLFIFIFPPQFLIFIFYSLFLLHLLIYLVKIVLVKTQPKSFQLHIPRYVCNVGVSNGP